MTICMHHPEYQGESPPMDPCLLCWQRYVRENPRVRRVLLHAIREVEAAKTPAKVTSRRGDNESA